jgi:SAM-dependent methyltransferase
MNAYVHGYHARESARLDDQASALVELLHRDTAYPSGSRVLEAGCGTGSQTVTLARRSAGARFTSIDISAASLAQARERLAGIGNVELREANVYELPFAAASFDHVFVCFLLEHLPRPAEALLRLKEVLRPGGTITVIEGDHGSAYYHPQSAAAQRAIDCLVELQRRASGDALIGRRLYPLLTEAGFASVHVSPRMVYADGSDPALVDVFTRRTFTAMVEGVRDAAIDARLTSAADFDEGVRALYRTAAPDGVFCYTFFKALAEKR